MAKMILLALAALSLALPTAAGPNPKDFPLTANLYRVPMERSPQGTPVLNVDGYTISCFTQVDGAVHCGGDYDYRLHQSVDIAKVVVAGKPHVLEIAYKKNVQLPFFPFPCQARIRGDILELLMGHNGILVVVKAKILSDKLAP